jgi:probable rRNA maturation factor
MAAAPKVRPLSSPSAPLQITIHAATGKKYTNFVRDHLIAARKLLSTSLAELSVAFVNDARMAQLHEEFLGIPGPTDVLTFELDKNDHGNVTSGEVIICVPEAHRQARQRGSSVERELLLYALHGMLHLSGFDDRTEAEYRKMHRAEDQILTQLGVGPVFASAPGRSSARSEGR